MAGSTTNFDIRQYLKLLMLRRYLFIGVFLAIVTAAVFISYFMPYQYRASTIVLVEASPVVNPLNQNVSPAFRAQQRMAMLKQLLFNRRNIERVANKLDLDINAKSPVKYEALIKDIQSNLSVSVKGRNLFQINYIGDDRKVVRDIVNTLASQYIEDNLQLKRKGSALSIEFHGEQLKEYAQKLEEAETDLKNFKVKNANFLSKRGGVTLTRVQEYQTSIMNTKLRLRELTMRKKALNKQLTGEAPLIASTDSKKDFSPGERLTLLETNLTLLLLRYTENYPDVIKVKGEIEELKKKLQEENKAKSAMKKSKRGSAINPSDSAYHKLKEEIENIDAEMNSLSVKSEELQREIDSLESSLEEIPGEEQELIRLQRDVRVYESIYSTLLGKLEEANITREMEDKEEAIIFKVIDPAVIPIKPAKPDRVVYMLFGLLAGIIGGGGAVFVRENYLDTSFKTLDDFKEAISIPVIATIPTILTKAAVIETRKRDIWIFSVTAFYLAVVVGLVIRETLMKYGLEVLPWGR
ncbi:MAG: XrtA system polysaccharide chain length determinant [Thermodesulfobacteriota bacterium]